MPPWNSAVLFARLELFQCRESLFPCEFARIIWLAVRICFHGCPGWSLTLRDFNVCCVVSVAKNMFDLEHCSIRTHDFVGTRINFRRMRLYSPTTAVEWLARQITESFSRNEVPRYLIRDRDRSAVCCVARGRLWPVAPHGRSDCRAPEGSDRRWTGHGASTMNAPQMTHKRHRPSATKTNA